MLESVREGENERFSCVAAFEPFLEVSLRSTRLAGRKPARERVCTLG